MHEAQMHRHNSFVTLTYNDENNPTTLVKRDVQLFLKRLRKALSKGAHDGPSSPYLYTPSETADRPRAGQARYYYAGEYGSKNLRPHYHVCLFGVDFADKKYLAKSPAGEKLYRSPTLETLWKKGFSSIGNITFESAAYVARYVMKKITGDAATRHYEKINTETGEIIKLIPEYNDMSRRPGIAWTWLQKYTPDVYPQGKVIVRGRPSNSPRYYDKLYKKLDRLGHADLKEARELASIGNWLEQEHDRLRVREAVTRAKLAQLKRTI